MNTGITNDPDRLDDEQYIVRLLGQVITVSLETMKVVKTLPPLDTASVIAGIKKDREAGRSSRHEDAGTAA